MMSLIESIAKIPLKHYAGFSERLRQWVHEYFRHTGHRGVEAVLLIACALCSRLELVSVRTQSLLSSRKGTQRQHERERLLVTMDATDASKRRLMSMR
ncbi:hypothetical protein Plhal304r1_c012g0045621 [Plasmopara halstedii]